MQLFKRQDTGENRFRKIFMHSNDAILIVDPETDRILDANTSACRMLGYSYEELTGMSMSEIHRHEMQRLKSFSRKVMQNRSGWTNELSCATKSGECLPSEISASLFDWDGRMCMVAMVRDVSERVKARKELESLNQKLEQLVSERTAELSEANRKLKSALEEVECLKDRLHAENIYLQQEIKLEHNFEDIITHSDLMKDALRKVEQVAATDATVLILGETGTGKELFARAVHHISNRQERPLVKVNCAALPANLIESELFGHEKGAFTGALARKTGRFELADGGTIFLDEIGDLPLELQAKLLRVLQEGEFERLGNSNTIRVDVRIIAATNRDLKKESEEGKFRQDLYYRLNVFPISVPPLRERKEDIPLLVHYFVKKYTARSGKSIEQVPAEVLRRLQSYSWPGNVRELENIIERAVIISTGDELQLGDWLEDRPTQNDLFSATLEEVERNHIINILKKTGWRVSGEKGAANILGMKAPTLVSRMRKLNIHRDNG